MITEMRAEPDAFEPVDGWILACGDLLRTIDLVARPVTLLRLAYATCHRPASWLVAVREGRVPPEP